MSQDLWVSTRKGLFHLRKEKNWEIQNVHFLGDPVTMCLPQPESDKVLAALNLGHFGVKLRSVQISSGTWQELACPAFPQSEEEPESLHQIWSMELGAENGHIYCGTIPAALFKSEDGANSWKRMDSLWDKPQRKEWFGGGYDKPGLHSLHCPKDLPGHIWVSISCGGVWKSENDGASFEQFGEGLRAAYMPPDRANDPTIQDPHLTVLASDNKTMWMQHHNGMFLSKDGGKNWQELDCSPYAFGFATAVHPSNPDQAWFVPGTKDECRVPLNAEMCVLRTDDGGKSFKKFTAGLPQKHAYDLVFRHALAISQNAQTLVMGSTTGNLWISEDLGENWSLFSAHLPPIYAIRFG